MARPMASGDKLVQTDLANTLDAIGKTGPRAFYEGSIADKIAAAVRQRWRRDDGGRSESLSRGGARAGARTLSRL